MEPEDESSESSCIEEFFENENIEDTFNERNSEINRNRQLNTRKNLKNDNNLEFEETRQILMNKISLNVAIN